MYLLFFSLFAHGDAVDTHDAHGIEGWIESRISNLHTFWLFVIIAVTLYLLGKGADILVAQAVTLSTRWGVPQTLIGATIVSLGTTTPEAAVSVFAAIQGDPDIALGNAVGSIICDTGLILGTAALIAPLPLNRKIVNRQGWIQLGAGFLLVIACLPFGSLEDTFSTGGRLPRFMGFVFLVFARCVYVAVYPLVTRCWRHGESKSSREHICQFVCCRHKIVVRHCIGGWRFIGSNTVCKGCRRKS